MYYLVEVSWVVNDAKTRYNGNKHHRGYRKESQ